MFSSFSLRFAGSQVLITYVFKSNAVHRLLYYEETGIFYNVSNAWGPCSHKMLKITAEEKWQWNRQKNRLSRVHEEDPVLVLKSCCWWKKCTTLLQMMYSCWKRVKISKTKKLVSLLGCEQPLDYFRRWLQMLFRFWLTTFNHMMCVPSAQGRSCYSGYLEVVF